MPGETPASISPNDCIREIRATSLAAPDGRWVLVLSTLRRGPPGNGPSPCTPRKGGPRGPVAVLSLPPTRLTVLVSFLDKWPRTPPGLLCPQASDSLPHSEEMGRQPYPGSHCLLNTYYVPGLSPLPTTAVLTAGTPVLFREEVRIQKETRQLGSTGGAQGLQCEFLNSSTSETPSRWPASVRLAWEEGGETEALGQQQARVLPSRCDGGEAQRP